MGVSREAATAVGVIIILVAINVVLVTFNGWTKYRKRRRGASFWGFHDLDAKRLVHGAVGPRGLFFLRVLSIAVFAFVIFFQAFGSDDFSGPLEPSWLTFFTNWTFMGFGLQALFGAYLAGMEAQRSLWLQIGNKPMSKPAHAPAGVMHEEGGGTSGSKDEGEVSVGMQQERRQGVPVPAEGLTMQQTQQQQQKQQQRAYGVLDKLYLLLFTTIFCGAFVSTVFYWASEYSSVGPVFADDILRHGGHLFLMLLDLCLARLPVLVHHLLAVVLYHTAYAVFMFIYSIESWVYDRLSWSYQLAPVFYVVLAMMILFSFALMYTIAYLRERLFYRGRETSREAAGANV